MFSLASETISCVNTGPFCVSSGQRVKNNECTYARKLCVTCTKPDVGAVKIRVMGNGLPKNCFYGSNQVEELYIDYEMLWNPIP